MNKIDISLAQNVAPNPGAIPLAEDVSFAVHHNLAIPVLGQVDCSLSLNERMRPYFLAIY